MVCWRCQIGKCSCVDIAPPQVKHLWMTLQAGGQEQRSAVSHRVRAAMGAVQDAKVVLLSFLSPLRVCSPGAAAERPWPHTPHCRALLLLRLWCFTVMAQLPTTHSILTATQAGSSWSCHLFICRNCSQIASSSFSRGKQNSSRRKA